MNIALVLAAGSGTRMNNELPKQFLMVNEKPLFVYSVQTFQNNPKVDVIVIATNANNIELVRDYCKQFGLDKVKSVIAGGDTRQASVYNGLKEIEKFISSPKDIVLIHDSARPLVSDRIIKESVEACIEFGAVDTVIQASDTIVKSNDDQTIGEILNRQEIYQSQTPQTFEFGIIKDAHEKALKDQVPNVTDDCKLVMHYGMDVHFVQGDKLNFKVTTPEDLEMFKALARKD